MPSRPLDLTRLRDLREQQGFDPHGFWSRFGVTGPAGIAFERGQPIPKTVALLLYLWRSDKLTLDDLAKPSRLAHPNQRKWPHWRGTLTDWIAAFCGPNDSITSIQQTLLDPRALRRRTGLGQRFFWPMLGTTQPTGSAFETGRHEVPKAMALLLHLLDRGRVSADDLLRAGECLAQRASGENQIPPWATRYPTKVSRRAEVLAATLANRSRIRQTYLTNA